MQMKTASASYLATKCLQTLAISEQNNFPIGSRTILNNFYVDDLLAVADEWQDAISIKNETKELLKRGGFELHKCASNCPELLQNISSKVSNNVVLNIEKNATLKTLGVQWNPSDEVLQYSIPNQLKPKRVTKRIILSNICQIFDPIGII